MAETKFPDWVNTLVNGALAGALLFGVIEIGQLSERVSVMESTVLSSIKQNELSQRTTDVLQDSKLDTLSKRMDLLELDAERSLQAREPPLATPKNRFLDSIHPYEYILLNALSDPL